jgi:HK97 family phage prohead protease
VPSGTAGTGAFSLHETKALPIADLKFDDVGSGAFSGYASTFGNVDAYGDIVDRGAYKGTIEAFLRDGFIAWSHDYQALPIALPTDAREDKRGLLIEARFHSDEFAQRARRVAAERAAAGKSVGLSIGFTATDFVHDDDGHRHLKSIDLYETSLVMLPANREATLVAVKSAEDREAKAEWDTAYVNSLPDSAFAVILPGGEKDSDGKTTPRSLRKLPHHNADGGLDMPHLRNALSRAPQTDMPDAMRSRAIAHLRRHMGAGESASADDLLDTDVPFEALLAQLGGWLQYGADEAEALRGRRAAEQRELSERHRLAIRGLLEAAGAASDRLGRLIAETEPEPCEGGNFAFALEWRRRRLALMERD